MPEKEIPNDVYDPYCIPRKQKFISGHIHSHEFQPRYDEERNPIPGMALQRVIKTYIHDVCIHCGMIIRRTGSNHGNSNNQSS